MHSQPTTPFTSLTSTHIPATMPYLHLENFLAQRASITAQATNITYEQTSSTTTIRKAPFPHFTTIMKRLISAQKLLNSMQPSGILDPLQYASQEPDLLRFPCSVSSARLQLCQHICINVSAGRWHQVNWDYWLFVYNVRFASREDAKRLPDLSCCVMSMSLLSSKLSWHGILIIYECALKILVLVHWVTDDCTQRSSRLGRVEQHLHLEYHCSY